MSGLSFAILFFVLAAPSADDQALAGRKFDQAVIQAGKKVSYGALIQVMDALRVPGE